MIWYRLKIILIIIQYISEPSKESTQELMRKVNVVIATGGMDMVKAAYSSGRPAYGVGPGNVQVVIDRDINFDDATKKIIASRSFNHGIPCASEQAVIVPHESIEKIISSFKSNGTAYIEEDCDIEKLKNTLFDKDGILSRQCIGISAYDVAKLAGIDVSEDIKILLVEGDIEKQDSILRIYKNLLVDHNSINSQK